MTDVDTVRLLIADLAADPADRLFTDAQLQTFLDLEDDVRLAAARACTTIATSEVLVAKKIRTQDLQTDGPAVAETLLRLAAELRESADAGYFSVIDFDPYPVTAELAEG